MTDSEIDRYLNEVCWAMGGSLAAQQAARDELRAHIADALRERRLQGDIEGAAVMDVLRDLGPAEDVGRALRASRDTAPLQRPLQQPEGALILERRRDYHLPRATVALALAAAAAAAAAVPLLYLWPRW
jgi:hypothetical protein